MSLKSVRWKESLTSSSSIMDTTEKCFCAFQSSKKSSVPGSLANKCKSSEKETSKGFAVGAKTPSVVSVCGPSGSCHHIAAIVCRCAWLHSDIACHHFTLLIAISARAGSTFHLWRSWALVQLRPWLPVAARSYDLPLESARRCLQTFLSIRFNPPSAVAYASRPVIDALTIRDRMIRRLWLQGERANQKPRNTDQFAAIACNLRSISALLLPLKAYLAPRCLALPRTFPKGTSDGLCSLTCGCSALSPI